MPPMAPRFSQWTSRATHRTALPPSTTSTFSKRSSDSLCGPVMFRGSTIASYVHFTSSAVTGRPSLQRASGSSQKTNSRRSSEIVQRHASARSYSSVMSISMRLSYIIDSTAALIVLLSR